jgi:putative peptidoglycan lipid II flippase
MKKIIIKLTGLKLVASLVGLAYSILQVRFFGASAEMDAYFVAMSAVYMITSLIQGGQLSEVFLPEYLKQKSKFGSKAAHNLLSAILTRMTLIVSIILIISYLLSPIIINLTGPGLHSEFKELGTQLFSLSLILIFFTLIGSFVGTTLNAEQIFGRSELSGLINGLVSIGILVVFYGKYGVFTLVYALLVGKIIEFLIGLYFLKQIGYKYRPLWSATEYNVSGFFKVMFTTSGYVGATQLYSVTITAMASFLPVGSLSIFSYVSQLSTKASNIIMGPISTVFFSKFSAIVSEGKKNLVNYLKKPLSYIFMITFIIFCFITLIGNELLHFLWSKKSLSISEFEIAYIMLCLNFFGFIFSAIGSIFRKSSVALGNATMLYEGWIVVQLFSAFYAFISIYFLGIFGLISILLINMVLMASTSFYISELGEIKSKSMIYKLIFNKKFILFVAGMSLSTLVIILLFNSIYLTNIYSLVAKGSIMGIMTMLLLYTIFKLQVKELLFSYHKK